MFQHITLKGLKDEAVLEILHREFNLNPGIKDKLCQLQRRIQGFIIGGGLCLK